MLYIGEATIIRILNSFNINSTIRHSRAAKESMRSKMKPVIQYDKNMNFINLYESIRQASKETYIDAGDIGKVCRGRRKTAGGYIWKFKE